MSTRTAATLYRPGRGIRAPDIGAKARGLEEISSAGLTTPVWFAVPASLRPPNGGPMPPELRAQVVAAAGALLDDCPALAVRSSAQDEDSAAGSFAGQYVTVLDVRSAGEVPSAIERCWQSADGASVRAYRAARGLPSAGSGMAVIVQGMVAAAVAGVCFADDPGSPGAAATIVAVAGLADRLVKGEVDGQTYQVGGSDEVTREAAGERDEGEPLLDDGQARAIATAARTLAARARAARDIEWALAEDGVVYILQTRPVTAGLPNRAGPDAGEVRLWDNSNIIESFPGVTLPLTFSIARASYAAVYRGTCRLLGVSDDVIAGNAALFEGLLGLVVGRVYYDVGNWHRLLALLPGFGTNQALLERMMGAQRPGQAGEAAPPVKARTGRRLSMVRIGLRAAVGLVLFERRARRFEATVAELQAEVARIDLAQLPAQQTLELYQRLHARAVAAWPVTIFNDLAVMILHGNLRRLTDRWLGEAGQPVVSELLRTDGTASTAPARELEGLAARLHASGADLNRLARAADPLAALRTDRSLVDFERGFARYVDRWGHVAPRGLQLEQAPYGDDPAALLATVVALARRASRTLAPRPMPDEAQRRAAMAALDDLLARSTRWIRWRRRLALGWLVARVRPRLVWRERMRAARIRVFAAARRIFAALEDQLSQAGVLDEPGDIHYLELSDIAALVRGRLAPALARELIARRRSEYETYAAMPEPPSRFETRGNLAPRAGGGDAAAVGDAPGTASADGERVLRGVGVSPGAVEAGCVVVTDPRHAAAPIGQIVVTHSTDPGWVPLMAAAAGLLVERGSLLSHSAIIARELGLPAIVGLTGITRAVSDGDVACMDGALGEVRIRPVRIQ